MNLMKIALMTELYFKSSPGWMYVDQFTSFSRISKQKISQILHTPYAYVN